MELILIRPEDLGKGSAYQFSDQVINALRGEKEIGVVGFGNAASLACMAVQISSSIANVSIGELTLDYIGAPALKISGVFFALDKETKIDWQNKKKELEDGMNLDFSRDGQLIVVSKNLSPDKMVPLCLSKITRSRLLKIVAAGVSINRAVSLALELTKGSIAREPIGIRLTTLSTIKLGKGDSESLATGIEIFLERGVETVYSRKHEQILRMLA